MHFRVMPIDVGGKQYLSLNQLSGVLDVDCSVLSRCLLTVQFPIYNGKANASKSRSLIEVETAERIYNAYILESQEIGAANIRKEVNLNALLSRVTSEMKGVAKEDSGDAPQQLQGLMKKVVTVWNKKTST